MKILIDAEVMQQPPTGIAKAALGLYRGCLSLDPSIRVAAVHQYRLSCDLPKGVRDLQRGKRVPAKRWRPLVLPLVAWMARCDAVHFPYNGDVPRLWSHPVVVTTLHDVLPLVIPGYFEDDQAERVYRERVQRDLDRTHLLITDSEYSKGQIQTHFSCRLEPLVVPLAASLDLRPSPMARDPKKKDYFLYVGGYHSRKGLIPLVNVFTALHREKKLSSALILTGNKRPISDAFSRTVAQAAENGIIEEKGYVQDSVLAELYANAKALIYPSRYEGFGLPPLEAMAMGCPVATTRGASLPEVCGDSVLYIDPDDERDFAAALIALEQDEPLRRDLAEKGLRQAAKFTWERSAEKYLNALRQTMKQWRSPDRVNV